jgi:hypothetical protein
MLYAPERRQAAYQAAGVAILVVALIGLLVYKGVQTPATDTCGFYTVRDPDLGVVQAYLCP